MRVAIVHDWLTGMRGGERVLEAMLELYPSADIFTLVHAPGTVSEQIEARRIRTSFLQRLPRARTHWRHYLPLFPLAVERLDVADYDLVLSSSHCAAKAVRPRPGAVHVSYCHTPMRYVWDQYEAYFARGRASTTVRLAMRFLAPRLRHWDRRTAGRVHSFVANSHNVAARVRRTYRREAEVVYPPVDVARFSPAQSRADFYLLVSALVPYKRVDLAVSAFAQDGRKLVIVGDGPEYARLRREAPRNVTFTGRVPDAEVASLLGRCRAFVQPGEEDFGIASVEAQAAGAPVVAYAAGGALETVIDAAHANGSGPTGVLFRPQTPDGLVQALELFETMQFEPARLAEHARSFAPDRFSAGFLAAVESALERSGADSACASPR
jgi:glycosyltransferase involved in cell wall biosynthesis